MIKCKQNLISHCHENKTTVYVSTSMYLIKSFFTIKFVENGP